VGIVNFITDVNVAEVHICSGTTQSRIITYFQSIANITSCSPVVTNISCS